MFTHVDRQRLIWLLALAGLVPPMLFLPPLVVTVAAGAVLTGIVITDTRWIGRNKPPISPPGPHQPSNQ